MGSSNASQTNHILCVENICLHFGGLQALKQVSFSVDRGEIYTIIGPNGAGKTSMLNCISGRYKPSSGTIRFKNHELTQSSVNQRANLGLGRTFQNLALFNHMTVLDNVLVGRHHLMNNNFLTGALYWLGGAQKEERKHRQHAAEIVELLGISHVLNQPAGLLSYGLQKRVELARAVALKPELILLDEPMAGMNHDEKNDMARYIIELNTALSMSVVMIEHDMAIVKDLSDRLLVLDFGEKLAEGEPSAVLQNPHVKEAYLGVEESHPHESEID